MKKITSFFSCLLLFAILTAFTSNKFQNETTIDPIAYKVMEIGFMWDVLNQGFEPDMDRDATWLDVGFRSKYAAVKKHASLEIIESTFGVPVFIRGPHDGEMNFKSTTSFGYYNPEFIAKLKSYTELALEHPMFKQVVKQTYDQYLKSMALTYQEAYRFINDNPSQLAELQTYYLLEIAKPEGSTEGSLQEVFRDYADNGYFADEAGSKAYSMKNPNADWYEAVTAPSFWLRRSIDGTAPQIYELLEMLINEME